MYKKILVGFLVLMGFKGVAQEEDFSKTSQIQTTTCDVYIDASPLNRTSTLGEENVINGNYQAVAQQYNNMTGQIKLVKFWGRVNPLSGNPTNTVKVVVYNANLGLPGTIIGQQNVILNSAITTYEVDAVFSSPLSVNGNIIIAIEPFSPSTDNYFIRRNTPPDGQNLNLIKIKQANQWFKNLAAGDPTFDYDFLILPLKATTVTANFSANTSTNITTFTNSSINGVSYEWNFGDGNTSTINSPLHSYSTSGTYNVKLKSYADSLSACADSVTIPVNVVITGLNYPSNNPDGLIISSSSVSQSIEIKTTDLTNGFIINGHGEKIISLKFKANEWLSVNIENLAAGVYIIQINNHKPERFIKIK